MDEEAQEPLVKVTGIYDSMEEAMKTMLVRRGTLYGSILVRAFAGIFK